MREPAALPGWTRANVIAHVGCAADAYLWLLAVARTGVEPGPRPSADALARAVEDGAARPAAELVAGLRARLGRLLEDAESMPEDRWDTLVTALAGWRHPAWYTLHRCWRELETHHLDLDLGYRTSDWPARYVSWALDDTLAALAAREFPVGRVEAVDLGRSWTVSATGPDLTGEGHALLGWLSGRTPAAQLTAAQLTVTQLITAQPAEARPLPGPPTWPLPPAPGWH